jgi:hypothetical protein
MKQFFVLFLIVFISISTSAQITFEKGYYIDNSGQKIECLIKNMDWRTNPTDFKYKGSESDKSREASLEDVQEFGVYNVSKYIRSKVKIDRSPNQLDKLANGKDPIFEEEILFLKVLLEGKANLYLYQESDHFLFFYTKYFKHVDKSK